MNGPAPIDTERDGGDEAETEPLEPDLEPRAGSGGTVVAGPTSESNRAIDADGQTLCHIAQRDPSRSWRSIAGASSSGTLARYAG